ncbi:nucleotidyltransferase domain-containing protein [Paenibacillus camelliae]|uniref:nucleotidyltransferase domain-containing protein n=1 Tax=Paenibacillus camelliae TaxID=512410 RepID=UPI00203B9890|nr:nucleotidyltransferase family protein [Paenibacillus camelliae]MCM3633400.1 nucleotidyltransferase family protein [Paenibacillus camelliae]
MEHNTVSFIALLSSHLKQSQIHPSHMEQIDYERLYTLGKIHSVSGMLYMSLKAQRQLADIPESLEQAWKQDFVSTISRAALQQQEMQKVIECFNNHQMKHVLFKGYALKDIYPTPDMRTMGDIDILIQSSDRQRSHAMLEAIGYKATYTAGNVWTYVRGAVQLEIHDHLISRNFNDQADYRDYYNDAWKYAVKKSQQGFTYQFTENDHLIYLFVHMAKHFYSTGCGIRMFMDIAALIQRDHNPLNWSYIQAQLRILKLDIFANHVLDLCQRWFDVDLPITILKMDERFYEQISEYIYSAGVFGYYRRDGYVAMLRTLGAKRKQEHTGLRTLRTYWSICFPSYRTLSGMAAYSFLKNRPLFLPLAWGLRAARSLLYRWKRTWRLLLGVVTSKKEYDRQDKLLEELGL